MKKTILFLLLALMPSVCTLAWKAFLVGHRGSDRGVENTIEAFRAGISYYQCDALECDVQVTKDNVLVLCHDSKLNNYGQNVVIGDKTLAELKALSLTQTRKVAGQTNPVTFTGTICTLDEYLQLCEDSAVVPVIELKSAKGLSGDNMSGFAALYTLLKNHHLDSIAYIASFDAKAIVWVKEHYPHMPCQRFYMSHLMTDEDIAWCVENRIEPSIDISYTYWDVHVVKRFHNAGLGVATWTINDVGTYNEFVRDRCCYMSTGDCVRKCDIADAPAINWDAIADYKSKLSPFYVTPLDSVPASSSLPRKDTLQFRMANHTIQWARSGQKGAFVVRDLSALNTPILHNEKASFQQDGTILFALDSISEKEMHVYGFRNSEIYGGWYVSNEAPQYQAQSVELQPNEVTMAPDDTLWVYAIVEPDKATSEVSWRIDKTRAFSLQKENRTCRLIAKSECTAQLIASIDGKKDTCRIEVKQSTALQSANVPSAQPSKRLTSLGVVIEKEAYRYTLQGNKIQ